MNQDYSALIEKAKKIKLVIFDIDGVLTDGRLYFDAAGNEMKVFHVQDGLGIQLLQQTGVEVAVISGRKSIVVEERMRSLGVKYIYQGRNDKSSAFDELIEHLLKLKPEQVAYVGDDLPDLSLIQRVGLGIAVANAVPLLRQQAAWTTTARGGEGAVREICELIMTAQGSLETLYKDYF